MKLDCVLTALNENPTYADYLPLFIKTWNKLYPNVDIKIILISDKIPDKFKKYEKNFILLPLKKLKLPKEAEPFITVYVRYLYPAIMNYENGVMITDIDMIPMNRKYFTKNIKHIADDKYVNTRDWNDKYQFASCYNVACPKIWSEIWNIKSLDDIVSHLNKVWHKELHTIPDHLKKKGRFKGWFKDQIDALDMVTKWNKKTGKFIVLNDKDTGFNRLKNKIIKLSKEEENKIKSGKYSDYHCIRPYQKHKDFLNSIYQLL